LIEFNLEISKKIPSDRILKKQIELINLKTCKHLKCFVETTPFIQAKDLEPHLSRILAMLSLIQISCML